MRLLKEFNRYQSVFFFILAIAAGIFILYPYHNFQLHLAQGDHGNNFYCFKKTFDGGLPYRDYWWVYGPLMPYYYSLFYHLFGVNMHSVLIGQLVLQFLCGIIFYRCLNIFFPSYMALMGAIFFWVFNLPFEHTYNHIGGVLLILATVYTIFLYIRKPESNYFYWGLISTFVLSLVKLNFGLAMLAAFFLSLCIVDRIYQRPIVWFKRKFLLYAFCVVPALIILCYGFFLKGLPFYVIRQCLLFIDTDPNHAAVWASLGVFLKYCLLQCSRENIFWFGIVLILSGSYFFLLWKRRQLDDASRRQLKAILSVLFIFFCFGLHEFLVSGIIYRTFWVEPLKIMIAFVIVSGAAIRLPKIGRLVICGLLLWMALNNHFSRLRFVDFVKIYIPHERAQIFTTNSISWIKTVFRATEFLKKHLKGGETFLALPSDQLYYFLTGKDCPVRQTEYGIHIHPDQEQEVIQVLENKKINYILLSNRYRAPETGFGIFGQAYCRKMMDYVRSHYKPIVGFGQWDKDPDWFVNHGVVILEKIGYASEESDGQ